MSNLTPSAHHNRTSFFTQRIKNFRKKSESRPIKPRSTLSLSLPQDNQPQNDESESRTLKPRSTLSSPQDNQPKIDESQLNELVDYYTKNGDEIVLSIWDFGGQNAFAEMQHFYVSPNSVFVGVFNTRKMLEEEEQNTANPEMRSSKEVFEEWLQSIYLTSPKAPIVIVGTHVDEISNPNNNLKVDGIIADIIDSKPYAGNIRPYNDGQENSIVHFIDNTSENDSRRTDSKSIIKNIRISNLRNHINDLASKLPTVNQEIPLNWLKMLTELRSLPDQRILLTKLVSMFRQKKFGSSEAVELEDEIHTMLKLFSDAGLLLYYPKDGIVVLDPQWVNEAATVIIRDHKKGWHSIREVDDEVIDTTWNEEEKLRYSKMRETFVNTGMLSVDLLDRYWRTPSSTELKYRYTTHEKEFLKKLFHDCSLMVLCSEGDTFSEKKFIIPSLLPITKNQDYAVVEMKNHCDLFVVYKSSPHVKLSLPRGTFGRILGRLLKSYASTLLTNSFAIFYRAAFPFALQNVSGSRIVLKITDENSIWLVQNVIDEIRTVLKERSEDLEIIAECEGKSMFEPDTGKVSEHVYTLWNIASRVKTHEEVLKDAYNKFEDCEEISRVLPCPSCKEKCEYGYAFRIPAPEKAKTINSCAICHDKIGNILLPCAFKPKNPCRYSFCINCIRKWEKHHPDVKADR